MTREQTLRETLAHNLEAAGYLALAKSARGKGLETFVSTALAFADAEAAAMRERAAGVASDIQAQMKESMQQRGISSDTLVSIVSMVQVADTIAAAIRALPATGEVGRG